MTDLLVCLFVKDSDKVDNIKVRTRYGILSGAVGIILNLILCSAKFTVGTLTHSIAITADAVNNLSDAGSSGVALVGAKVSGMPADDEHPFGHGRLEYITAMIVSFIILIAGFELAKSSVEKIITPQPVTFDLVSAIVIGVSILGKVWLAFFNKKLGTKINSPTMKAVVSDSISDIAATTATLIALIISKFSSLPIDGYLGVVVALFVFAAGIGILKNTIDSLMGEVPSKAFVKSIEKKIMMYDNVQGIHDLMLHNYGPGRFFGSVHVEMPADVDVLAAHGIIDIIERDFKNEMNLNLVIHFDPIVTNDEHINSLKTMTVEILNNIDEKLTLHDFRVVYSYSHTNLIFDVVVPRKFRLSSSELSDTISKKLKEIDKNYYAVITVEHSFV